MLPEDGGRREPLYLFKKKSVRAGALGSLYTRYFYDGEDREKKRTRALPERRGEP
nr:MAG TPA: hypothetical protein [Caudoviricetes sp.]